MKIVLRYILGVFLGFGLLLTVVSLNFAQASYFITRSVWGAGGALVQVPGEYSLYGTLGEAVSGRVVIDPNSSTRIGSGFWHNLSAQLVPMYVVNIPTILRGWPPIPDAPDLFEIDNADGDHKFTVRWTESKTAEEYRLLGSVEPAPSEFSEVYRGSDREFTTTVGNPTRYYYCVQALNKYGSSPCSGTAFADVIWEMEPNDRISQANGPLVPHVTYLGKFSPSAEDPLKVDEVDMFYFQLPYRAVVQFSLRNIAPGHNYDIYLWSGLNLTDPLPQRGQQPGNADEVVTADLDAGTYYIQVNNSTKFHTNQPYHLRIGY